MNVAEYCMEFLYPGGILSRVEWEFTFIFCGIAILGKYHAFNVCHAYH